MSVGTGLKNDTSNSDTDVIADLNASVTMSGLESGHTDTEDDLAVLVNLDGLGKFVNTGLEHNVVYSLELVVDGGSTVVGRGNVNLVE